MNKELLRIRFTTPDGVLVMNREAERYIWLDGNKLDVKFAEYSMACDARLRGVHILSYKLNADASILDAVVEWL
jgi:hypothetical protein